MVVAAVVAVAVVATAGDRPAIPALLIISNPSDQATLRGGLFCCQAASGSGRADAAVAARASSARSLGTRSREAQPSCSSRRMKR